MQTTRYKRGLIV